MLEVLVLAGTIAAAAAKASAAIHQRRAAVRFLEQWATARKHVFVPAKTAKESPRTTGADDEVSFVVDFCKLRGELSTRVTAPVTKGSARPLSIVQRRGTFRVHGASVDEARQMLGAAGAGLAAFGARGGVWLACDGGTVTMSWNGLEAESRVLDAGVALVVAAARAHRPDRPYR